MKALEVGFTYRNEPIVKNGIDLVSDTILPLEQRRLLISELGAINICNTEDEKFPTWSAIVVPNNPKKWFADIDDFDLYTSMGSHPDLIAFVDRLQPGDVPVGQNKFVEADIFLCTDQEGRLGAGVDYQFLIAQIRSGRIFKKAGPTEIKKILKTIDCSFYQFTTNTDTLFANRYV